MLLFNSPTLDSRRLLAHPHFSFIFRREQSKSKSGKDVGRELGAETGPGMENAVLGIGGEKGIWDGSGGGGVGVNGNRYRLERFGKAMSGTGSWEAPGAVLNGESAFPPSVYSCFFWQVVY